MSVRRRRQLALLGAARAAMATSPPATRGLSLGQSTPRGAEARRAGRWKALLGIGVLIPDGVLIRYAQFSTSSETANSWAQLVWRGACSGVVLTVRTLVVLWRRHRESHAPSAQASWLPLTLFSVASLYAQALLCARCGCRPERLRFLGRTRAKLALGALLYGTQSVTFVLATGMTSVANVLIMVALSPLCGALWERALLGKRLPLRTWAACVACVACVAAVLADSWMCDECTAANTIEGDAVALIIPISLGLYFTVTKPPENAAIEAEGGEERDVASAEKPAVSARRVDPGEDDAPVFTVWVGNFLTFAAGLIGLLGVMDESTSALETASKTALASILIMSLVVIPGAFTLLTMAAATVPSAEVSLIMLLELVISPFIVWGAGFERPSDVGFAAGGCLLATLIVHSVLGVLEDRRGGGEKCAADPSLDSKAEVASDEPLTASI